MRRGLLSLLTLAAATVAAPAWAGFLGVGWDGPGRGSATLSFHIAGSGAPDRVDERDIIIGALQNWVDTALLDITFNEVDEPGLPDALDFRFRPLDGPAGELGYAFFPDDLAPEPLAGDVILDATENWTGGRTGAGTCTSFMCDLYYVALHEIGHALGLDHPDNFANTLPPQVMNPFFNPHAGTVRGFGAFDTIQPRDVAIACRAYACTGNGAVRLLERAAAVDEPSPATLLIAGLLILVMRHRAGSA